MGGQVTSTRYHYQHSSGEDMMGKCSRGFIAAGAACALLLSASPSFAGGPTLDACQKGLELATNNFRKSLQTALVLCVDTVRKQQVKEATKAGTGPTAVAAKLCEVKLAGVYDVNNLKPGVSSADKMKAAIDKLFGIPSGTPKCNAAMLAAMGHGVTGAGAPPLAGNAEEFTEDALLVSTEQSVIDDEVAQTGDALNLIAAAVSAPESKPGKMDNTDCSNMA